MIDVIIPAYNAHDTIKKTLDSIKKQTLINKLNIYICDDCSKSNYSEIINEYN